MSSLFLDRSVPDLLGDLSRDALTPAALLDEVENRIAEWEGNTRAWVHVDLATARGMAGTGAPGVRQQLRGIPFGIKDIFNTKTLPTEMGSPFWKGFTPGNDARVVASLVSAGAVPVGKTVTAEFAVHALNDTLNPHDALRTPGTSSSGSAAAVARGMVPFALGTQTAGSIVRPASFCGVWGMKPSFGLIPRTGVLKTTDSLDTIGFLCAHGRSLRPLLDATRVSGPNYPYAYRHVDLPGGHPKSAGEKWKLGFVRTHVWGGAEPYATKALESLVDSISGQQDFEIHEVPWPAEMEQSHGIHSVIYAKSLSYYFQQEAAAGAEISPIMASMIEDGRRISGEEYVAALAMQEELCRMADELFAPYDFAVSLGTSGSAPLRHEVEIPDPSLIWTLCHLPVVAAPTGRNPDGMPFGVQFTSRKWNDYRLLQAVEALMDAGILPAGSMEIRCAPVA